MKKTVLTVALLAVHFLQAQTPKSPLMGWASFNHFRGNLSDSLFRKQADAMVSSGINKAGYKYINVDDFYSDGRDENGNVKANYKRFPYGMKSLADYIHSKGLKAGMYSDCGPNMCSLIWDNYKGGEGAGFYGNLQKDVNLFLNTWGYDYIKVDYCGASQQKLKLDEKTHYSMVREAIIKSGKKDVNFNVCRWQFPGTWVTSVGDSWRISGDIRADFKAVMVQVDKNTFLAPYMAPGHYNDMDMLEVGNGMKVHEDKAHFTMWCLLSSPLVLGNDMTNMTAETIDIITNKEAIAVNQDYTEQGKLISNYKNDLQVWYKKLNGKFSRERAIALLNRSDKAADLTVNFSDIELKNTNVKVYDVWDKKDKGISSNAYTATVAPHSVVFLKLKGAYRTVNTYEAEYAYLHTYNLTQNTVVVANQAKPTFAENASKKAVVTSLGNSADNYIEFREVYVPANGKYKFNLHYINQQNQEALMSVNGQKSSTIKFENSNNKPSLVTATITLKKGFNKIKFSNATAAMPDMDKLEIFK